MTIVAKDFFVEGMTLPVPLYLRMGRGNYLTIGRQGDKARLSSFHSLTDPKVSVYVRATDHTQLIEYMTNLTGKVISQQNVPDLLKVRFINSLADDALNAISGKGFASVAQMQRVSMLLVDLGKTLPGFQDVLKLLMDLPVGESKHAMATCMISLAICEEMKMNHRQALEKVALGSLLHDVGLKSLPKGLLSKPKHLWTPEELQAYEQHPVRSVEMLRDLRDITNDVLLIVVEHHENSQGTGFPKKLRDVKISPLGKVVGVGNYFASLLFSDIEGAKIYTADEAIAYMEEIVGQPYNRQVFLALKNIVNKKSFGDKADKKSAA